MPLEAQVMSKAKNTFCVSKTLQHGTITSHKLSENFLFPEVNNDTLFPK